MRSRISAMGADDPSLIRDASETPSNGRYQGRADWNPGRSTSPSMFHGGLASREASVAFGSADDLLSDLEDGADVPEYECSFECVPASVTFRPARVTPWPVMRGTQTARVSGPAGEEIHTDKYGRVKVQFNWDREGRFNEDSSCWIRVSHGMAGGGYGMMFLPRVGQEVVVDFLEGNPDKPIIVGSVYNADHMPPYALPADKTKSVIKTNSTTGGGGTNEICFEDRKDSEQLLIHAQRDFHVRVKHDRVETVENDHLTVEAAKHELVKKIKRAKSSSIWRRKWAARSRSRSRATMRSTRRGTSAPPQRAAITSTPSPNSCSNRPAPSRSKWAATSSRSTPRESSSWAR
ncbi:MAG: type VI secretion system tip protein VgrG [Planctomycetes bacterium]|nr:type VI secretion system tip protein VgrG [Planctomycetota bacterium]